MFMLSWQHTETKMGEQSDDRSYSIIGNIMKKEGK
jgi:hypothetical protein